MYGRPERPARGAGASFGNVQDSVRAPQAVSPSLVAMTQTLTPTPTPGRRRRPRWPWAVLAGLLAVGAVALALFQPWKLWVDDVVDEAAPDFAVAAGPAPAAPTEAGDAGSPPSTAAAPPATTVGAAETGSTPPAGEASPAAPAGDAPPAAPTGEAPVAGTTHTGTFEARAHPAEGTALVLSDGAGRRVLRFEDFATDNGPDLFVYLSSAPPGAESGAFDDDFVRLGRLKGNIGDQNYDIPPDVDLSRYSTVAIWCDRFNSLFGVAALTAP